ncbi:hypothetical protein LTR56_010513 [Elasticomyces elasticus]|nr:hypothetical protein LTR56_010513 [Elasticomyces elasticus]KAK3657929.1 hypothetical protein LTR22_009156 [Elasticomyces elasticus]KAK4917616.1 hypothetical protein LTR49_014570 [Elasticomyces elasticus]KAK5762836.1 hypothetical protein LTS12_007025 [Elasticomyces elasticus]
MPHTDHFSGLPNELKDMIYDFATVRNSALDGSTLAALICAFGYTDEIRIRRLLKRGGLFFRHPEHLASFISHTGEETALAISHIYFDILGYPLATVQKMSFAPLAQLPSLKHIEIGIADPPSVRWEAICEYVTRVERFGDITPFMQTMSEEEFDDMFRTNGCSRCVVSKTGAALVRNKSSPHHLAYERVAYELKRRRSRGRSSLTSDRRRRTRRDSKLD